MSAARGHARRQSSPRRSARRGSAAPARTPPRVVWPLSESGPMCASMRPRSDAMSGSARSRRPFTRRAPRPRRHSPGRRRAHRTCRSDRRSTPPRRQRLDHAVEHVALGRDADDTKDAAADRKRGAGESPDMRVIPHRPPVPRRRAPAPPSSREARGAWSHRTPDDGRNHRHQQRIDDEHDREAVRGEQHRSSSG